MNDMQTLTGFFGWCTVINIAGLALATVALTLGRRRLLELHRRLLGMDDQALIALHVNYMANYKLAILMLNIVPYLALKIIG